MAKTGINLFIDQPRSPLAFQGKMVRPVYFSGVKQSENGNTLSFYLSDKAPLYYRRLDSVIDTIKDGNLLTAFAETLKRIPQAASFQESHAGEIIASLFAQEHLNLVQLYSKLHLLTSQNANALKMDLVLCDPSTDPITFILGEVKTSMKAHQPGTPPGHDASCFNEIFRSLSGYTNDDLEFDLTAARDALKHLDKVDGEKIRLALMPYTERKVRYAAFAIIDRATFLEDEAKVLATRANDKSFEVDVVAVDDLRVVATTAFDRLNQLLKKCSP